MKKRKWLSLLLAVMMLISAVPLSSVTANAAGGTVEVSTWEELKRALEYTITVGGEAVTQNVKIEYQRNISEKVHLCQRIRTLLIQKDFLDMVQ